MPHLEQPQQDGLNFDKKEEAKEETPRERALRKYRAHEELTPEEDAIIQELREEEWEGDHPRYRG